MNNYLYPFFWLHGEEHSVLEECMEKIAGSGMKGACLEARPHPDFVGDGWWSDVSFIIEKAKELDMKLWILDEFSFSDRVRKWKSERRLSTVSETLS